MLKTSVKYVARFIIAVIFLNNTSFTCVQQDKSPLKKNKKWKYSLKSFLEPKHAENSQSTIRHRKPNMSPKTVLLLLSSVVIVNSFPDGAPVDACVKPRPNQPYHGQARTQPPETNPYLLLASGSDYQAGTQITGKILIIL